MPLEIQFTEKLSRFERLYEGLEKLVDLRRFSPALIAVMVENAETILAWVKSEEFKTRYKNHRYPPLLDPKSVDYFAMPPQYAWNLNLPLPPYLKFVFLRSHACGATGLSAFFKKCGGEEIYCGDFYTLSAEQIYAQVFNAILQKARLLNSHKSSDLTAGGGKFIYLLASDYAFSGDYEKYFALIPEIPALHLTRDPVSVLKSVINYKRKAQMRDTFTLTCSPQAILEQRVGYGFYTDIKPFPLLDALPFWIFDKMMCFHDSPMIEHCVNVKNIYHLDMQETIGEQAALTTKKIAQVFDFEIPQDCRDDFLKERIADFEFLLPITLCVHPSDVEQLRHGFSNEINAWVLENGIPLTISTSYAPLNDKRDITSMFFQRDIAPLAILASPQHATILAQNPQFVSVIAQYLEIFAQTLFEIKEKEKQKGFSEQDILDYLRHQKFLRERFKCFAEEHIAVLRREKPQIVESWRHYANFLALCEECK